MSRTKLIILAYLLSLGFMASRASADGLEGVWGGHMLSVKGKVPDKASFNWQAGKWDVAVKAGTWTSYAATLELQGGYRDLHGTYAAKVKNNAKNWGKWEISGNFNFPQKLMVWQPDRRLEGNQTFARTVIRSLEYAQEGKHEYLRGRWASSDGQTGVMEFRRDWGGEPLKDDEVKPDFVVPEPDKAYVIKAGEFFLGVSDDKAGVVSKKDGDADLRKWKFEPAPDAFPKAFRIVPAGKDDHCLVPADDDSGRVTVAAKADDAGGGQYWRFERNGDAVSVVNVKFGGRALYVEDPATGDTIIRSRNEAHESKWELEKL